MQVCEAAKSFHSALEKHDHAQGAVSAVVDGAAVGAHVDADVDAPTVWPGGTTKQHEATPTPPAQPF